MSGATSWHSYRVGNVEVLTDASHFASAEIHRAIALAAEVLPVRNPRPLRIVLLRSSREFDRFRPDPAVGGFFTDASDRDLIVLEDKGDANRRTVIHEYVHLVLRRNSPALRLWFEEGVAEFYSTLEGGRSGIVIGKPIDAHLQVLRNHALLPPADLARIRSIDDFKGNRERVTVFYAQSWLLTHMIHLAPEYRGATEALASSLDAGEPFDAAVDHAFPGGFQKLAAGLAAYLSNPRTGVTLNQPVAHPSVEPVQRTLSDAEALSLQADILTVQGRHAEAGRMFAKAVIADPDSRDGHLGLAGIALRERRYADARSELERVLAAAPGDGETLFEYATVLRQSGAPRREVTDALTRAVTASPQLAEGHLLLGTLLDDAGDHTRALEHLRRSADLQPRNVLAWQSLALSLAKAGAIEESRLAARRAMNAAQTPEEIEIASGLLNAPIPARATPKRPAVVTPQSWNNPQGGAHVEGRLKNVECLDGSVRLRVGDLTLEIKQPDRVVLEGTRSVQETLRCGPQDVAVQVDYDPATREVTRIRFQ